MVLDTLRDTLCGILRGTLSGRARVIMLLIFVAIMSALRGQIMLVADRANFAHVHSSAS